MFLYKKFLSLLLFVLVFGLSKAQEASLFDLPDIICAGQRLDVKSFGEGSTFYWNFCSGTVEQKPVATDYTLTNMLANNPIHPTMVKDNGNFYMFYANSTTRDLIRCDYGNNLNNQPVVNNLGTMGNTVPENVSAISFIKGDNGNWFAFMVGFTSNNYGTISRIDFGSSITNNTPITVNFGEYTNTSQLYDLSVQKENTTYIAYAIDASNGSLIRIDFGSTLYNNPVVTNKGGGYNLYSPKSLILVELDGSKYGLSTTQSPSGVTVLNFGTSWTNNPTSMPIGTFGGLLSNPFDITYIKDCGTTNFIINNFSSLNYTKLKYEGDIYAMVGKNLGNITSTSLPSGLTEMYRNNQGLFLFESNQINIAKIEFAPCTIPLPILTSNVSDPEWVKYYMPGFYNIYHIVNEGMADEVVQCKEIEVIDRPSIDIRPDTIICRGDSVSLWATGDGALAFTWDPNQDILNNKNISTMAWPDTTIDYTVFMDMDNGCNLDTFSRITVSQAVADAGPDQTVSDGSTINIGGSGTTGISDTGTYVYQWTPSYTVVDPTSPFTKATPTMSDNYILKVVNAFGCVALDTARIWLNCDDVHLPNSFCPNWTNPEINTFKLLNKGFIKLNKFQIFNRYGNLIWETTDPSQGWNGYYNNVLQDQDNYVWLVEGVCNSGYLLKRTGTVLLLH